MVPIAEELRREVARVEAMPVGGRVARRGFDRIDGREECILPCCGSFMRWSTRSSEGYADFGRRSRKLFRLLVSHGSTNFSSALSDCVYSGRVQFF